MPNGHEPAFTRALQRGHQVFNAARVKTKSVLAEAMHANPPKTAMAFKDSLESSPHLPRYDHRDSLSRFIGQKMVGCQLHMPGSEEVAVVQDALSRFHEMEQMFEELAGLQLPGRGYAHNAAAAAHNGPHAAAILFVTELAVAAAMDVPVVKSAVQAVFGSIPGVAIILSLGVTAKEAVKLADHEYVLAKHQLAQSRSISVIQNITRGGIMGYERRRVAHDSGNVGVAATATGAAALPLGATSVYVAGLATRFMAKIIELIRDHQRVQTFNHASSHPNLESVEAARIPALYLPRLGNPEARPAHTAVVTHAGIDAMSLLGITPVGWQEVEGYEELEPWLRLWNLDWLLDPLTFDERKNKYVLESFERLASAQQKTDWGPAVEQLAQFLKDTDEWMGAPPWKLCNLHLHGSKGYFWAPVSSPNYAPRSVLDLLKAKTRNLVKQVKAERLAIYHSGQRQVMRGRRSR